MLDVPTSKTKSDDRRRRAAPVSPAIGKANAGGGTGSVNHCEMRAPILTILHQRRSNPGHIGQWLRRRGHALDIRRPALGDKLPQSLQDYAGVVIFGGPMSANDPDSFLNDERGLIELSLRESVPCLGVCLGAQLMAQVLGVEVRSDPECFAEIGYYRVEPTAAGQQLCVNWPEKFYQWHRDGFDLPHGATLLARADGRFPCQAFGYGKSAVGIQFHPEITLAMMNRWTILAAHRLSLPGAQPREAHFASHYIYQPQVARWRDCFLEAWVKAKQIAIAQKIDTEVLHQSC